MIRKYYGCSVLALLLIPVTAIVAAAVFGAIDPELARGHDNYVRNFALLSHLRVGVLLGGLVLMGLLWLLACLWLLRAKSRRSAWLSLALLGPLGYAVLMALSDHSSMIVKGTSERRPVGLPQLLRVLYEIGRFVAIGLVAQQLVDWFNYGTALLDAARRGLPLAAVLAERDASSGMWAFGDSFRVAGVFVLIYALWPLGSNAVAGLMRRLRRHNTAASG